MTPGEAVVMDWLLERGYTREQAARALVALTLPEPDPNDGELKWARGLRSDSSAAPSHMESAWIQAEAERRGYLPRP